MTSEESVTDSIKYSQTPLPSLSLPEERPNLTRGKDFYLIKKVLS